MSKHTPGPWKAVKTTNTPWSIVVNHDGPLPNEHQGDLLTQISGLRWESDEANAHLIAAAPELLEALKRILENKFEPDKITCIAEAAIAKAEGRP